MLSNRVFCHSEKVGEDNLWRILCEHTTRTVTTVSRNAAVMINRVVIGHLFSQHQPLFPSPCDYGEEFLVYHATSRQNFGRCE